jgi:hypothetical protein
VFFYHGKELKKFLHSGNEWRAAILITLVSLVFIVGGILKLTGML